MDGRTNKNNLTVMIVGSLTGGTGAGLFLQLPLYIRKVTKDFGLDSLIIRGMFVGPEITANVQPSKINRDAVRVNAYSCLKELNAFYMMQNRPIDEENNLEMDYYPKSDAATVKDKADQFKKEYADMTLDDIFSDTDAYDTDVVSSDSTVLAGSEVVIPYDYLYLIEESVASGSIGLADLSSLESQVGHMAFTLMFTPVSNNALSVEDNMVLQDMETGGMGRYSGAGLCRLVFPHQLAKEYVSLCTVRDLVKDEWMLIDRKYESLVVDARIRQRTDGTVDIPKLGPSFVELFKKEVNGNGKLGKLYKEAYLEIMDPTFGPSVISRAHQYMTKLTQYISDFLETDELLQTKAQCTVNEEKMKNFSDATHEIARVTDALNAYIKFAKLQIKRGGEIANEIFPTAWKTMTARMEEDICIYNLLANAHPITARFFCYSLIDLLEKEIRFLEASTSGLNLNAMDGEDYDEHEAGVQSAAVAVRNLEDRHKIGDESKKLKKLRGKFRDNTSTQVGIIDQYRLENTKLAVFASLLDRLEILAEEYRVFFDSISTMIRENNDRIERLEKVEMELGQIGVYCSKEAFRCMAAEYKSMNADVLPQSTQAKLFEQVFRVFADFYSFTQKDWETLYDTIERRDPIGMIGVKNFFYGLTGDTYVCQFSYTMPIDELKKTKAQTEDLVDQAIQKMNVQGKSDFDKVFTVNQYLCQTVYYPDAPYPAVSHTPYGALKNGCAVCEGYTSAAFLILNKLGVDCDMEFGRVHNSPPNERHVWNLVKLDGQWYQLDITWNDVDGNNANQFFLVTDDYMKQTRSWYEDSYPRCADKAYRP